MQRISSQPEILMPRGYQAPVRGRFTRANRLFRDENLGMLSHLLDDCFRIPGTSIRFGLDGIIGLIPGVGDILAGLASSILLIAAWARGVPYVTLVRMMVNLGIGLLVGSIPFVGDVFLVAWRANRRNYALLTGHIAEPRRRTGRDWIFLLSIGVILLAILTVPLTVFVWMLHWLFIHV